jgi:hypothetical protein
MLVLRTNTGFSINKYIVTKNKISMGDPVGHIWIKREFTATCRWPGEQFTLNGVIDMEKEYKDLLLGIANHLIIIQDISILKGRQNTYVKGQQYEEAVNLKQEIEKLIEKLELALSQSRFHPGIQSPSRQPERAIRKRRWRHR